MYYSSGNYEAFATPKKPEGVDHKSAYIIGSGLAALTAACYLVRDGQMKGEHGYNLKTTPIVFVGGGAVVMKNFGSHDAKNISYNLDVKANARGYEQLATMGLKSTKRLS